METVRYDTVVVGAGVGGVSAALGSARAGAKTLLIEARPHVGGTGVYSPLGILCGWGPKRDFHVNRGVLYEFYPHIFPVLGEGISGWYDAEDLLMRYETALDAEEKITVWTGTKVEDVETTDGKRITAVHTSGAHETKVTGNIFIDSTAEGHLGAMAGAEFQKGRKVDGAMQPATLTFTVSNIDLSALTDEGPALDRIRTWADECRVKRELDLNKLYTELKEKNETTNPKTKDMGVLCFALPDGRSFAFNHTRVIGVDSTDPESVAQGKARAEKQVWELWEPLSKHPAMHSAKLEISSILGIREGRRIIGDYILTREDCIGEARFDDMVAACCYAIDIHHPEGGGTELCKIPGSGYYHIPYRSLRAKAWQNLLMGSRCISGTHEAHSSYRVMAPVSAIGQAAGVAAALTTRLDATDVRKVNAAQIRHVLAGQNQFVEGETEPV